MSNKYLIGQLKHTLAELEKNFKESDELKREVQRWKTDAEYWKAQCETKKTAAPGSFSFGAAPTTAPSLFGAAPSFSFGAPSSSAAAPSFSFGAPSSTAAAPSSFGFGSSSSSAMTAAVTEAAILQQSSSSSAAGGFGSPSSDYIQARAADFARRSLGAVASEDKETAIPEKKRSLEQSSSVETRASKLKKTDQKETP